MSYESGIVWTVNPHIYISFSSTHTRWCRAQCFRLFTSKTSVSSLITWVQLNLAIITVHFNYAKRWRVHSLASFDVGRTNRMPIKNLKEQTNAWWEIFVSADVFFFFFFAEEWWEQFRISPDFFFHFSNQLTKWEWIRVLVDEKVQFEYAVCGRGNF